MTVTQHYPAGNRTRLCSQPILTASVTPRSSVAISCHRRVIDRIAGNPVADDLAYPVRPSINACRTGQPERSQAVA